MDDLRYLTPILIRHILIFHFHITHSLNITVLVHLFICLMHTFVTFVQDGNPKSDETVPVPAKLFR